MRQPSGVALLLLVTVLVVLAYLAGYTLTWSAVTVP